ncbi:unnamed protein product [Peniophora sp. CBMAI 1063]|nr:unnamed protein product [Peniophora sp. CBMAI 1063]
MAPHQLDSSIHPALATRNAYSYSLFGNVSDTDADRAEAWMDALAAGGYITAVMSLLFAILSVTFFMALRYLLKDGLGLRVNKWMLAAVTLMYGCAAVGYAFQLITFGQSVKVVTGNFTGRWGNDALIGAVAYDGQYVILGINVLCGDLVILWRTGVIWHNSKIIRRLNWFFLIMVILTWIAGITILSMLGISFLLVPLALSLSVNIWSTSVIGYKTWHRRRMIRQQVFMAGVSHISAIEHALAVITETGIAYTLSWVAYVVVVAYYFFGNADISDVALQQGYQWLWMIMSILIPLYPISLILLIARHKAPLTETLTSIDVTTIAPTFSTGSVLNITAFHSVPSASEKVGDALYDPYVDVTASSPGTPSSSSFRMEPNRRGRGRG